MTTTISKRFAIGQSKASPVDVGINASSDGDVLDAIRGGTAFPDRAIDVGHVALDASTPTISFPGARGDVTMKVSAGVRAGVGVFSSAADAVASLALQVPKGFDSAIAASAAERFAVMLCGYNVSAAVSGQHPIGVLGAATFGVDAKRDAVYAVVHGFDAKTPAVEVLEQTIGSWRLPGDVTCEKDVVNLAPRTWIVAEADGSLAFKLGARLGYELNFSREVAIAGLTKDLSVALDARLQATFGFNVSGSYLVVVGREDTSNTVRLRLFKASKKGLNFGLNLDVGVTPTLPLPATFDDLVQALFGVHGPQVVKDLKIFEQWTDPETPLGTNIAHLTNDTALSLLESVTGIDPKAEFDKSRGVLLEALDIWDNLPDRVASLVWDLLGDPSGQAAADELKRTLEPLVSEQGAERAVALASALRSAVFGDSPQARWLNAISDQGLLALANDPRVGAVARSTLNALTSKAVKKLQGTIASRLNLDAIRRVADSDFGDVDRWLVDRLAGFLNKTALSSPELEDIRKALHTVDTKIRSIYEAGVKAATKRQNLEFAATYERTSASEALLDASFDLSQKTALAAFAQIVHGGAPNDTGLDEVLAEPIAGVTLGRAALSHSVHRATRISLAVPFDTFEANHVNEGMARLTVEEQAGRVLVYELKGKDTITRKRYASDLSVLASLRFTDGAATLDARGSLAYETLQVGSHMALDDLRERTQPFLTRYFADKFSGGAAGLASFYADLDGTVTDRLGNRSSNVADAAISMTVAYPVSVLAGWFRRRSAEDLHHDGLMLSRRLQRTIRPFLASAYFDDIDHLEKNASAAPLLVWSSLPVSTSARFDGRTLTRDTDEEPFWDVTSLDLRRAMTLSGATHAALAAAMLSARTRLQEAGSKRASDFDPQRAEEFIQLAISREFGDEQLALLLRMERDVIKGAIKALSEVAKAVADGQRSPTVATREFATFASVLTDAFHSGFGNNYRADALRGFGAMILAEASAALTGGAVAKPSAALKLYVLKSPRGFQLSDFMTGALPPSADVALAQTLVTDIV